MDKELQNIIEERPGISEEELRRRFGLSGYRLNREFRKIGRRLNKSALVHNDRNGVWIVEVDGAKCAGLVWVGANNGGYRQCDRAPEFDDGCCHEHSQCENPEMVAFVRKLGYLAGPREPGAYNVGLLNLRQIEKLTQDLNRVTPLTLKDQREKADLLGILAAARSFALYRDMRRRLEEQDWIPPEFASRHRQSSINPFEYGLKKHFETLGISSEAKREDVLKAWRKLARKYHPDAESGCEEKMKAINLAKERIFRIRKWDATGSRKQKKRT